MGGCPDRPLIRGCGTPRACDDRRMTAAEPASVGAVAPARAGEQRIRPPLVRPRVLVLGGVSVALARHLGMPVVLTRVLFAGLGALGAVWMLYALWVRSAPVAALAGLAPALLYAWLWALVPREPGTPHAPRTRLAPVAAILIGCGAVFALIDRKSDVE